MNEEDYSAWQEAARSHSRRPIALGALLESSPTQQKLIDEAVMAHGVAAAHRMYNRSSTINPDSFDIVNCTASPAIRSISNRVAANMGGSYDRPWWSYRSYSDFISRRIAMTRANNARRQREWRKRQKDKKNAK